MASCSRIRLNENLSQPVIELPALTQDEDDEGSRLDDT
jgi:hypothetical protein